MHAHAAIDIKTQRLAQQVNRLDPDYLLMWRAQYDDARGSFVRKETSLPTFTYRLQALGFRDDALKAEIREAEQARNDPAPKPARTFRYVALT